MRLIVTKLADNHPGPFESEEEIRAFFTDLVVDMSLNFHPDTPFSDYYHTETGERTFDNDEADVLDDLMDRAFDWAADSGGDLYEIALDILLLDRDAENERKY